MSQIELTAEQTQLVSESMPVIAAYMETVAKLDAAGVSMITVMRGMMSEEDFESLPAGLRMLMS